MSLCRQKDLAIQQYQTLDELEEFAEGSRSSILYIIMYILGCENNVQLLYAASHIGVSLGLISMIRSTASCASQVLTSNDSHI